MPSNSALYIAMLDVQTCLKELSAGKPAVQVKFTSQENADAFVEVVKALCVPLESLRSGARNGRAARDMIDTLRTLAAGKPAVRPDFADVAKTAAFADIAARLITALESMKVGLH